MPGTTTAPVVDDTGMGLGSAPPHFPTFVILACPEEPHRVGEHYVHSYVPHTLFIGRGNADSQEVIAEFGPPRLGAERERLRSSRISRLQYEVAHARDAVALRVKQVGQGVSFLNARPFREGLVSPGDLLHLEDKLLLLCIARPVTPPRPRVWSEELMGEFGKPGPTRIVGEHDSKWALLDDIALAAREPDHVLISGESGTGKELVARAIHARSPRAGGPWVAVNAAAIPKELVVSELFGNTANYTHGGMRAREGLLGEAQHGTLFIDEIGELSREGQAALLRMLDAGGEYKRLGEDKIRYANVRIIVATNRPITQLKHDLIPRLKRRIDVLPLRKRRADIPLIARHIVESNPSNARFLSETGAARFHPSLMAALVTRELPGNVRELANLLQVACDSAEGSMLRLTERVLEAMKRDDDERAAERERAEREPDVEALVAGYDLRDDEPEPREPTAEELHAALLAAQGNRTEAARRLGLTNRYAVIRLIKKHGVDVPSEGGR